jgi:hypothetical protein
MDSRDCLALYPFVVVRIACRVCSRSGSYRLARLAAKFGPEISLRDLTDRFSYDCLWRAEAHGRKGKSGCGVYLPDLHQPPPPGMPPGIVKLRLVKKTSPVAAREKPGPPITLGNMRARNPPIRIISGRLRRGLGYAFGLQVRSLEHDRMLRGG